MSYLRMTTALALTSSLAGAGCRSEPRMPTLTSLNPTATLEAQVNAGRYQFSPDSAHLAYIDFADGAKETVVVYSLTDRKPAAGLRWDGYPKEDIAFSPDGSRLVLAAADDIRVWDWKADKQVAWPEPLTKRSPLRLARFGPGRDQVFVADAEGDWRGGVRRWDIGTGKLSVAFDPDPPPGPADPVGGTRLATTRDGGLLGVSFLTHMVLLDAKSQKVLGRSEPGQPVTTMTFSPDGKQVAQWGQGHGVITLWSVPEFKAGKSYDIRPGLVWACDFLPDGRLLILATPGKHDEYQFILWDPAKGEEVWRIDCVKAENKFQGFRVSPDGKWLALGFDPQAPSETRLTLWKMEDIHRLAGGVVGGTKK